MTNIINLTPHAITIVNNDGDVVRVIEPSGTLARLATRTVVIGKVDEIPITGTVFGEIEGLPEPTPNTVFITSSLVAGRVPDRDDVFIPNESVRDDKGRIIGCRSLGRI